MGHDKSRILIVDDDAVTRAMLRGILGEAGHQVGEAKTSVEAKAALNNTAWDLVLLDRRLPDGDGLLLIRRIQESRGCPIIVLSVLGDEQDRMLGLGLGAIDYITKPFNANEIRVRIRNLLAADRRPLQVATGDQIAHGPFCLRQATRQLLVDGRTVRLSPSEARLLAIFLTHAGEVLDRSRLTPPICGRDWSYEDRAIDVLVARLRKRIEADPKNPQWIITVHGDGYCFLDATAEDASEHLKRLEASEGALSR
ncbi:response regulator transcription factor [Tropicimonas isoalkanivorans]|uniref:Two-component system, OmpR family, torCAD operon response regulator TorR n=1 Tax=Tropicimonas isoalkanivorans TaxID=441112 RepID=A0A1I1HY72_9RHOB|nr:response regulator transcription factor [Tropicimonas isoalkanivorans]SFC26393.1 two-component system, OmpR family, torCAD operon response regulator TorR [Tropicimonas isoalkanivorans]